MMNTLRPLLTLAVLSFLPLASCQDADPFEPDVLESSLEDQLTLELLADPASVETALELAGIQNSAAQRRGWRWGGGDGNPSQLSQAEHAFRNAQEALANGNQVRAMEQAREGRRLVAQTIEMVGGPQAIMGMVERLEALPLEVSADPGSFSDSGRLGLQLGQLAVMARSAIRSGNRVQAGALGILSEQAFRHNHRHQNQVVTGRAEVMVALATHAIELAESLLAEQDGGADVDQLDLLAMAQAFLEQAEIALEAGEDGRSAHLAHMAAWWALKAVVLPGGITDDEAKLIFDLATNLLEEAKAALELIEPSDLQIALLAKATTMLENGEANLENGTCRGLGALWQSAVISSYLIG